MTEAEIKEGMTIDELSELVEHQASVIRSLSQRQAEYINLEKYEGGFQDGTQQTF